jgi:hypothetical protein
MGPGAIPFALARMAAAAKNGEDWPGWIKARESASQR